MNSPSSPNSPKAGGRPGVSVVIPTLNGGPLFREVLDRVFSQECDRPFEVLCIDSGSTDGTAEYSRSLGARVIEIPKSTFNHGLTRNQGIRESRGEYVALLVQDATPLDNAWLSSLLEALESDDNAGGAYSRQLPREDCNPFIRERLLSWSAGKTSRETQALSEPQEWDRLSPLARLGRIAFDDVSSMIRRRVWNDHPYQKRNFGEDLCYAKRIIQAGYNICFEPRSQVIHSHNNSIWYEMRRLYADHHNLQEMVGLRAVPSFADLRKAIVLGVRHYGNVARKDERLGFLSRTGWTLKSIPFSVAEALGKYLGGKASAQLPRSAAFRRLDRFLRKGV